MKSIGSPMRIGIMGTGGIGGCGGAKLAGKGADVLAERRHSSSGRHLPQKSRSPYAAGRRVQLVQLAAFHRVGQKKQGTIARYFVARVISGAGAKKATFCCVVTCAWFSFCLVTTKIESTVPLGDLCHEAPARPVARPQVPARRGCEHGIQRSKQGRRESSP